VIGVLREDGSETLTLAPQRPRPARVAVLAATVAIVAAGVLVAGVDGAWTDVAPLIGQTTVFLTAGMVTAVSFGAILLASTPALVALFALPSSWAALVSLSFFGGIGPWVDTARALSPMHEEVLSATQWAHAAPRSRSGCCWRCCSGPTGSRGARSPRDRLCQV